VASANTDLPPTDPGPLAAWFGEAVRAEIAELEKKGGAQIYELLSGRLVENTGPAQRIYEFIIADGTRIPEDSAGRLETENNEYAASVIAQEAALISLRIDGEGLPTNIPRALLTVDDTALLRSLAEVLEGVADNTRAVHPLAATVFHPGQAQIGSAYAPDVALKVAQNKLEKEQADAIAQALGSSLTFIWGPPGTGKTHVIAALVEQLLKAGERVLVTSHTHAAVDQALDKLLSASKQSEPLALAVAEGKVLCVGQSPIRPVPDCVRLDRIAEARARELQEEIAELEAEARPLAERLATCAADVQEWETLEELRGGLQEARNAIGQAQANLAAAEAAATRARGVVERRGEQVERAQRAWFWRAARTATAMRALQEAKAEACSAERALERTREEPAEARILANRLEESVAKQQLVCQLLQSRADLEADASALSSALEPLEERIRELQDEMGRLEREIIDGARLIFCTLTKLYKGRELEDQWFHAVIVDEISMALPPLVFLAAGRAASRVILVGDFLQLPPIIRSDEAISNDRLRRDVFHLAELVEDNRLVKNTPPVLVALSKQRRMVKGIADVARYLAYDQTRLRLSEHPCLRTRPLPEWLDFLPDNPLVIVDTADLHCWSGRQSGSLSRFNFYSARVAVELAAMAAETAGEESSEPGQLLVGIVTPYAAQRRLLSNYVAEMGLAARVLAGTIYTFQGAEADLIIFDSVLDEPHWATRLCDPDDAEEVRRDLNVAVTRAKNKLVFLGSSEWLNRRAGARSGLGQLWAFLRDRADLVSATELVEMGFHQRVSGGPAGRQRWEPPPDAEVPTHEILDETSFFERFAADVSSASRSIFALAPYFGEYRWPRVQPLFSAALERGVEVTLVTPPPGEAENAEYVRKVIENLWALGAIVVPATGMHGKDIVIDERIHYTGSLNWPSHRGRSEIMHRTDSPRLAKLVLQYMQAKYIRMSAVHEDGTPRVCPRCGWRTQVVNQRRQRQWDYQPVKIGCTNPDCEGYLRDIDERAPFRVPPRCQVDGRTKYRRVRRGRGEVWHCPKHPKECDTYKVVPGDPE